MQGRFQQNMAIQTGTKKLLEKQGYRFTGKNSAVKVCDWTRKAIRGSDVCYKAKFYGIRSWRCIQLAPALENCTHKCVFCWRYLDHTSKESPKEHDKDYDDPNRIVENAIKEHVKYLRGFGGAKKKDIKRYNESLKPQHFAISLAGEPTLYPRLPELIDEIHKRKMSSFLVSNGTQPEMLKKLIGKHEPTQLYLTLPAPNEEIYKKTCRPLITDGWKRIAESLKLFSRFKCRKAIRLTLVKGLNMEHPELYARILKDVKTDFIEIKAYMWVGYSRERLRQENMPLHSEIREFAEKIAKELNLKIADEKKESRVVLLKKSNIKAKIDF